MAKVRIDKRLEAEPVLLAGEGQMDLEEAIKAAGWDAGDPGRGRAVILTDGRELVSSAQFEAPADIDPAQDMFAVMEKRIMDRLREQAGILPPDAFEETVEEANDYDVPDDVLYVSGHEVVMADEFPQMPTPRARPSEELLDDGEPAEPVADPPANDNPPAVPAPSAKRQAPGKVAAKSKAVPEERDPIDDH